MTPNFNLEVGQLLVFIGKVATAIRMNSPYNSGYKEDNPNFGDDVRWLSDCLHHFEQLGNALIENDLDKIEFACSMTLSAYEIYNTKDRYISDPSPTFSKQTLFCLDDARDVLIEIQRKIFSLREQ